MYEVIQTGVFARISSHRKIEAAARKCRRVADRFRRSSDYNPGSPIGFAVVRSDGAPLSSDERAAVERIDEAALRGAK